MGAQSWIDLLLSDHPETEQCLFTKTQVFINGSDYLYVKTTYQVMSNKETQMLIVGEVLRC